MHLQKYYALTWEGSQIEKRNLIAQETFNSLQLKIEGKIVKIVVFLPIYDIPFVSICFHILLLN